MMRRSFKLYAQQGSAGQLLIIYGSQTGTAEAFARMLGPVALKHKFEPVICTMDDAVQRLGANSAAPAPRAVLCVCSTYGTGEFPSNAQHFADALEHGQLPKLKGVDYSVLGLGNSHNEAFNAAAKAVDKRLRSIGANPMVRMQLSCEVTQGHDTAYRTWKRAVWAALDKGASNAATDEADVPITYAVTPCVAMPSSDTRQVLPTGFARATIHRNVPLTPAGYEPRVGHITFTVPSLEQIRRFGGRQVTMTDNVVMMPQNSKALVERALARLHVTKRDAVVEVTPLPGAAPSYIDHRKMRVDTLLRDVIDLSAIPSRSFLESLSTIAQDAGEKTHLEDLANDLSSHSEYDALSHGVFSVMDALEMFPSCKVTLEFLLTHAPHVKPRSYSLSRDNTDWKHDEFEFVYTVPTRHADGKDHVGMATGMLENLKVGQELFVKFEASPTRTLPSNAANLCIVALGSGIGAARALLHRRRIAKRAGATVGPCVLYYGFRHAGQDELFTEELASMEKEGLVEVRRVASHDGPTFRTPLDVMDASLGDFLAGQKGEVLYCGMGGSVPGLVEATLRKHGVNVADMRAEGRYHEEYFTSDPDTENMLRSASADANAATLAGRMGGCQMFCMQCEQTFRGKGCHTVGVCGKTPRVAYLQDLTVHLCKILGFYAHALREAGVAEDHGANRLTLYALFSTLTNVNFDEARFLEITERLRSAIARLEAQFKSSGVPKPPLPKGTVTLKLDGPLPSADKLVELGKGVGVLTRFTDANTQSQACLAELLTYGLKGLAAYTDHSLMNGKESPEVYAYMHKALAFLLEPARWEDLGAALAMCLECGKVNLTATGMLYDSNATLGVPSPHVVPVKPRPGKAILVSGHDLIILDRLLAECKPLGIDVYTHGEMLPAHSYPKLRAHGNLAGHFGGAWMRQSLEFPHFPGPVIMTTNCLTEPHDSYRDTIFTAGAVGWQGVKHIGDDLKSIDFASVIEAAQKAPGFTASDAAFSYPDPVGAKRPATLTVGFGHETVLGAAGTVIDQIQKGNISRFFLVGGCDGFEGQRSYYTDLVKQMPKTGVVLTLGCGKFRFNHLTEELGTIGDTGLPRVLDMGQCNDAYSAIQVAVALAKALNCEVGDLPLTIALSWFEQKAVAVLLTCLHLGLKPLHIGPTLPAFVTPQLLDVLVNKFGVRPIGKAEEDLKAMTAAKGSS